MVGRHEEHRFHIKTQGTQAIERGDACQTDRAFNILNLELVVRVESVSWQRALEIKSQLDRLAVGVATHAL